MLETDNLLLLTVLVMGLSIHRMDIWSWVFSRVVWVERAWLESLSAMKILLLFTYFPLFSCYLSVGGIFRHWVRLESVRLPHVYTISSVECSICEVGTNSCFCGAGCGMCWNRCSYALLDIPRNWPRFWNCWWAAVYLVKRGLSPGKIETNGPPRFMPLLTEGLDSHSPNSGWIFWPNKLVFVGPEVRVGGWCWAFKMVAAMEVPRHGLLGINLSGSATGFWRLMELDLIQVKGLVDDGFVVVKGKKWRKKKTKTGGHGECCVAHVATPLPLPKGSLRDKGKIPVSNQFASLGGPVLEDFDDYFDGSWSPKLKAYFYKVIEEDDELIGSDDDEEPPDDLLLV
ncbi:hypothetical protein L1987_86995 [Smallanthus sonchifolius]|uniref:Uncharacterized protein n=1 Tax=Smallanthus sonchifolius TaxID=185202 RepID=A0ACB8Y1D0_9ASTR|nr:hypothetical protein L1987_86995 [Smallanthus sonchifolius]